MTSTDHTFWYLTRAGGLTAYVLLFVAVAMGLLMTAGLAERTVGRYRIYDLHRFVSLLALGVTVFHVLIVLPDGFIGFSVAQLLIPFASPYRAGYMALGGFALYIGAIAAGSFYLRPLVSYRAWRLLHYSTLVAFAMALVHSLGGGTDSGALWARWLYAGSALVVFALLVYRVVLGSARGGLPAARATASLRAGK